MLETNENTVQHRQEDRHAVYVRDPIKCSEGISEGLSKALDEGISKGISEGLKDVCFAIKQHHIAKYSPIWRDKTERLKNANN